METWLAIASRREVRDFTDAPVPSDIERRILDAGRLAGSSRNTQLWEFVVVEQAKHELSEAVYAPSNVANAPLVVAIVGEAFPFDVGRAASNMMLAAWELGVGSVPNGIADRERANELCGGEVKMILSFGYPAKPRDVDARSADEWSSRAKRKPLDELVRRA